MIRALAALCGLLFWAGMSVANPLPALYEVTGVAADDRLNVRNAPDASAQKLGSLAPDQRDIEVVATDASGRWGLVNIGERSGWVAMRYLRAQPGNPDYALGRELRCYGTEPFWSLHVIQGRSAAFATPGNDEARSNAGLAAAGLGRLDRFVLGLGTNGVAILRRAQCDDGMSDRSFGIEIDLVTDRDGMTLYSGCCSVSGQ